METVGDLLKSKGTQVYTAYQEKTVGEAIATLVEHNIGSLVVVDAEHRIAGIMTERDLLRRSYTHGPDFLAMRVNDVMTGRDRLIVCLVEDRLEYVLQVMTGNRIRHIPVIQGERLLGMLSIGDVVKALHQAAAAENHYLRDYLTDKYPA